MSLPLCANLLNVFINSATSSLSTAPRRVKLLREMEGEEEERKLLLLANEEEENGEEEFAQEGKKESTRKGTFCISSKGC